MKYYIDESGNTGDLILTEDNLNFSNQEYFTLSCIGINCEILEDLDKFISMLKKKYKIQSKELKFSKIKHIFGSKIQFIYELYKYLLDNESKFIIEIVDKKYILSTNIVTCLVNPPYFQPESTAEDNKMIHLIFSQWIYDNVPEDFFVRFTDISRNPSSNGLESLFNDLITITKKRNDDLSKGVLGNVEESLDDYEKMKLLEKDNKNMRQAFSYFLPLPDLNKRNELIGVLPHIASFTNIHARLNYMYGEELSEITIVHDNQDHFDEIIKTYHENATDNNIDKGMDIYPANYNFTTISNLKFANDKGNIGLQIADIFAGFINKSVEYLVNKETYLNQEENFYLLRTLVGLYGIQSINFVLPINTNEQLLFPMFEQVLPLEQALGELADVKTT